MRKSNLSQAEHQSAFRYFMPRLIFFALYPVIFVFIASQFEGYFEKIRKIYWVVVCFAILPSVISFFVVLRRFLTIYRKAVYFAILPLVISSFVVVKRFLKVYRAIKK